MRSIIIRSDAEADLDEAREWYETRRKGLGAEFLDCVDATIQRILQFPDAAPLVHKTLRRAFIRRFPYGVFYVVEDTRIVVIGVIHASRSPRVWKKRHP